MSNALNLAAANFGTLLAFKKEKKWDEKWVVGLAVEDTTQCLTIRKDVTQEETKYFCQFEDCPPRTLAWKASIDNQLTLPRQAKHTPDALHEMVMEYYQILQMFHLPTVFKSLANVHRFNEHAFHENLVYATYYSAFDAGAELQVDTREPDTSNSSAVFSRTFSIVRRDKKPVPKIYFNGTAPLVLDTAISLLMHMHQYLAEQKRGLVYRDQWALAKDLIEYHLLDQ